MQTDDRIDAAVYALASQQILEDREKERQVWKSIYWMWATIWYKEWIEWSQASLEWSRRRRSLAQEDREARYKFLRLSRYPAVLGLALAIFYTTLDYPLEHWYVGLLGVSLMVPYLTRRLS